MSCKKDIVERACAAMGYRCLNATMFAKPAGMALFVYDITKNEWRSLFHGTSTVLVWQQKTISGETYEDVVASIALSEAETDLSRGKYHDFAFLTSQDEALLIGKHT